MSKLFTTDSDKRRSFFYNFYISGLLVVGLLTLLSFQNCSKPHAIKSTQMTSSTPSVNDTNNTDVDSNSPYNTGTNQTSRLPSSNLGTTGKNQENTNGNLTTTINQSVMGSSSTVGSTSVTSNSTSNLAVSTSSSCNFLGKSVVNTATVVGFTQDYAAIDGCSQYEVHYRCNNGNLEKINSNFYGANTAGSIYNGDPNKLKLSCKQEASLSCTAWKNADGTYEMKGKFVPATVDIGKEGYYFIGAKYLGNLFAIRLDFDGFFNVPNINHMPGFTYPTQLNYFKSGLINSANVGIYFHRFISSDPNVPPDKVPRSIDEITPRTIEVNLMSKENTVSKGLIGFSKDPAARVETHFHIKTSSELSAYMGAEFYLAYSLGSKSEDSVVEPKLTKLKLCAKVQ